MATQCTIVNREIQPGGIIGDSAGELARYLTGRGVKVSLVSLRDASDGQTSASSLPGEHHLLRRYYNGKNKVLRLLSSLLEGRQLARRAVSVNHGPIICMTNPPLLNFWVARQTRARGVPWLYWSLDLYPEAFLAAGLAKATNFFYRFFKRGSLASTPSHLIALGPRQAEHIQADYSTPISRSILPCGIVRSQVPQEPPSWAQAEDRLILGYAGNLGEAHSAEFVKALIEAMNPERHRFVLAAAGAKADQVLEFAQGRPGVTVLPSVPREQLRYIDVHLVSLLPEWDHICVPSKAFSAVCEGGSILFHGSEANDNWQLLGDAGWRLDPSGDMRSQAAEWMKALTRETVQAKKAGTPRLADRLFAMKEKAFEEIYCKLEELCPA